VIEVFVYPLAWPTHIQWAAMMLVLLCRGAGTLSLDAAIKRSLLHSNYLATQSRKPLAL